MLPLLETHQQEITELCQRYQVKQLGVFGSAARQADFTLHSDIDSLVEFGAMSPGDRAKAYFGLWFDLEKLLGKKVDLAEPTALNNPYVKRTVQADLIPFYATA